MCTDFYQMTWPSQVKADSSHEYFITTWSGWDSPENVVYALKRDGVVIETAKDRVKYLRYFRDVWEVTIDAVSQMLLFHVRAQLQKKVRVYKVLSCISETIFHLLKTGIADILEK